MWLHFQQPEAYTWYGVRLIQTGNSTVFNYSLKRAGSFKDNFTS